MSNMTGYDTEAAVRLTGVNYSVERGKFILKDINVTIPHRGIYAILGPSGCGKTTLLKVLSRLLVPSAGTVTYSYKDFETRPIPGNGIGYMPQDTGLILELSVEENLRLFSALNRVGNEFEERKDELMSMLEMCHVTGRIVGNLSGGEKRRLSLVVALLHHPPVVVLDEPTVGVDPLLRQTIWKYLGRLASTGTTVIITSHYVDEAKDADSICFMRNGRILAETTPTSIQEYYENTRFESCYTKLFEDDEAGKELSLFELRRKTTSGSSEQPSSTIKSTTRFRTYMAVLGALTVRNLHFLRRNVAAVCFFLVISIVQPLLFSTIVGSSLTALPIAIANEEQPGILGPRFLKELDTRTLWLDAYSNRNDAIDSVKDGSHWGAVHIGANFTRCLFRRFREGLHVSNSTLDCGNVKVHMDTTNSLVYQTITGEFYSAWNTLSKSMLISLGTNPVIAESPLQFEDPPVYGSFDVTMTEYIIPNVLIALIFTTATMSTAMCLVAEKQSGALHRILVTGATRTQLLLSQFLCQTLISLLQMTIAIFVPYAAFSIPIQGSVILSIFILFFLNICGNTFGLFVSSITDTFSAVITVLNGFLYPASLLSGFFWPLEGMPTFLRYFSYLLPMTMQMESLRCVVSRGWGLTHTPVLLGFASSFIWTIVFFVSAVFVFKYRK